MLLPNTHVPGTRTPPTRMTAARYLKLRRKAAGLTRYDLARRLSMTPGALINLRRAWVVLGQLELPNATAKHPALIDAIAEFIPLDVAIYHQLANDPVDRHPTVCLACGCSAEDPCTGASGICTLERGTCTRCQSGAAQ
ncbi:helix-turn-helix domain-containing protein [Sphingomonas elodea]|uniref:helix-turn-helix domain-containing protein n=1 Tax=Sphingomonas elodea TaxID=179878 RepID=UPI00026321F2|nr:helix-turn-helix transcriptional regulator [Sphingomonas elodea]